MSKNTVNKNQVKQIAQLANIPVSDNESQQLVEAFAESLIILDQLQAVKTTQLTTTHQVTGFKNVTREDKVDDSLSFTQQEALANASQQQDGYFLVPQILKAEDN